MNTIEKQLAEIQTFKEYLYKRWLESNNEFADTKPVNLTNNCFYHPCTYILIEGLKELPNGAGNRILNKWDKARAKVNAAVKAQQ